MHHRPRASPLAHVRKHNYLSSDPVPSLNNVTATFCEGQGQVSMHGDDSLSEAQSCLPDMGNCLQHGEHVCSLQKRNKIVRMIRRNEALRHWYGLKFCCLVDLTRPLSEGKGINTGSTFQAQSHLHVSNSPRSVTLLHIAEMWLGNILDLKMPSENAL